MWCDPMPAPAIRIHHLGKRYRIGEMERYKTLRDTMTVAAINAAKGIASPFRKKNSAETAPSRRPYIWALKDVSFDIFHGDAVGIIGPNGAGKSTLLKLLSRITEPTEGQAEIYGRIGSLLEVGTGFHPELTGRENIYMSGAVLGMRRAEIDRKFDDILAFAELEKFVDTPVKRFSSGMFVRLAFAVAANLETEILLVDEVLSVGDSAFQQKSLKRMQELTQEGRTILFVSHNLATIQSLCDRAILLSRGHVVADGEPFSVIDFYQTMARTRPEGAGSIAQSSDGKVELVAVDFLDTKGAHLDNVFCGQDVSLRLLFNAKEDIGQAVVNVGIENSLGIRVALLSNLLVGQDLVLRGSQTEILCRIPTLPLAPGEYSMSVKLSGSLGPLISAPNSVPFRVETGDFFGSGKMIEKWWLGSTLIRHDWTVRESKELDARP
jgi:lipopolysaccharide transport system ATP-binding protein